MEINNPRPKKFGKCSSNFPLPSIKEKFKTNEKIKAVFNGLSVHINNLEDMKTVFEMGCYGKGNFSRSYPQFDNENAEIIRARQYDKRMEWTQKTPAKVRNFKKIIIVDDSDDEYENYFNNLSPSYDIDKSGISEAVFLSLEEAFFLSYCLEALDIQENSKTINFETLWATFSESNPYFISNYVAYNYFRSKNWIVKPGTKFGGDYLLYKEGPSFYHASYVVILDVFDKDHKKIDALSKRSMDNISLLCLNRICETAGKELMVCEITLPEQVDYTDLTNVNIKEVLVNRCTETLECS